MSRRVVYLIFGAVLLGALAYMVYDNVRLGAARSWPSTEGRVFESAVVHNPRGKESYSASVAYSYRVEGRAFVGRSLWLTGGQSFGSVEDADAFLGPYRVGNPVRVFYDAANPADSALIIERGGDPMVLLIIVALWGLIGTFHYPRAGGRMPWRKLLAQMGLAAVLVGAGYIVYVLIVGEI